MDDEFSQRTTAARPERKDEPAVRAEKLSGHDHPNAPPAPEEEEHVEGDQRAGDLRENSRPRSETGRKRELQDELERLSEPIPKRCYRSAQKKPELVPIQGEMDRLEAQLATVLGKLRYLALTIQRHISKLETRLDEFQECRGNAVCLYDGMS
jgi:hypothetical protein